MDTGQTRASKSPRDAQSALFEAGSSGFSIHFHSHIKPINAGQLLAIPQLPPIAFESAHRVRMSTKCYNKIIDNNVLLLLPYPMFRPPRTLTLLDLLPVNSLPGACPDRVGELKSKLPLPLACSTPRRKQHNPLGIRTSAKCAHKPFRIRTSKTQHLIPFRIRTCEKTWEGDPLPLAPTPPSRAQFACSIQAARKARDA
jgi:hypothetical protein